MGFVDVSGQSLSDKRLSEIKDLLRYESSISFQSHRAAESMWLLVAEVERLRAAPTPLPAGLDARCVGLRYSIHCSFCGRPHEGEFGRTVWAADEVAGLGRYGLDEDGWLVNLNRAESELNGHVLVCPGCAHFGWCEECDSTVYAWESRIVEASGVVRHNPCRASKPAEVAAS